MPPDRQPSTAQPDALIDAIESLIALGGDALGSAVLGHLRDGQERLRTARFNLVVLGEFKRGKSTLINALLGSDVLPTGVVPLTSVITLVRSGSRPRLIVELQSGERIERPVTELARFVTERENPDNREGVQRAVVELPADILDGGLQVVDTPGIGSVHAHNTAVAWDFLPSVDAALCVLSAEQPLAQVEREFFRTAAERSPRLIAVLNKIDHLAESEVQDSLQFVREASRELVGGIELDLFAVSARTGDGLPALRERLTSLSRDEAQALLLTSVGRLALAAASSAVQVTRFEADAAELPLIELDRRAASFKARAQELASARDEAAMLLRSGVERMLTERVNRPLTEFVRDREPELVAALSTEVAKLDESSPRELAEALDAWIDATIRERFDRLVPELEAAVAEDVRELQQRFAVRTAEILVAIQEAADETFGTHAAASLPAVDLSAPAGFTFKLADVAHMLDSAVEFGLRRMPGRLGRKLVTRDAQERLLHMADRHAGRLRSALVEHVRAAVADYERRLSHTVDDAIAVVRSTLDRVAEDRARSTPELTRRRASLESRAGQLEALRDLLAAVADGRATGQPRDQPEGESCRGAADHGESARGAQMH